MGGFHESSVKVRPMKRSEVTNSRNLTKGVMGESLGESRGRGGVFRSCDRISRRWGRSGGAGRPRGDHGVWPLSSAA